jgi:hypothetical protein
MKDFGTSSRNNQSSLFNIKVVLYQVLLLSLLSELILKIYALHNRSQDLIWYDFNC